MLVLLGFGVSLLYCPPAAAVAQLVEQGFCNQYIFTKIIND
jgi:hypothetical protein